MPLRCFHLTLLLTCLCAASLQAQSRKAPPGMFKDLDDVIAARDWVTIEAKLTVDGELVGLVLRSRSGSYSIDESLLNACQQGAWDQNPPPEAKAEDGLIHFIFRSDINAQYDQLGLKAIVTFLQVGLT